MINQSIFVARMTLIEKKNIIEKQKFEIAFKIDSSKFSYFFKIAKNPKIFWE